MTIFESRIDNRGKYSGITGVEFPVMNYFMSAGYEIEDIHAEEFQQMIDDGAKYLNSDSRKLEQGGTSTHISRR